MTVTDREDTPSPEAGDAPDQLTLPPAERIHAPMGRTVWLRLSLPVAGVLMGLLALYLVLEGTFRRNVFLFLGTYMLPGGIDYGIPLAIAALGVEPLWVVALITYFDLWITLFWVWNLDHLARFERIERRINKSRARCHKLWQRAPWLRVATGPGLALFILLPIPWTGSFAGIVVGKLLDLRDPVIYVASIVGTLARVAGMAYGWAVVF